MEAKYYNILRTSSERSGKMAADYQIRDLKIITNMERTETLHRLKQIGPQ